MLRRIWVYTQMFKSSTVLRQIEGMINRRNMIIFPGVRYQEDDFPGYSKIDLLGWCVYYRRVPLQIVNQEVIGIRKSTKNPFDTRDTIWLKFIEGDLYGIEMNRSIREGLQISLKEYERAKTLLSLVKKHLATKKGVA